MNDEKPTSPNSSSSASDKEGTSALGHEAKHVEHMMQPNDGQPVDDHDEAELVENEKVLEVEADARVQAVKRQAKETGSGSNEPHTTLNQDG